jgi:hypothetical protein
MSIENEKIVTERKASGPNLSMPKWKPSQKLADEIGDELAELMAKEASAK